MATKRARKDGNVDKKPGRSKPFHLEFLTAAQKIAWAAFDQSDVLFLLGEAGTGKSYLAVAFAVSELLAGRSKRIVLTRPVVEAGEKLGFLPGFQDQKLSPYLSPLYDCLGELVGFDGPGREKIQNRVEIAPLAYIRGRTFRNAVCIFDEAQNATFAQLKLYLTRLGQGSKMIITGDPSQTDLRPGESALAEVVGRLSSVPGIGVVQFGTDSIVRHDLIAKILEKLN